MSYELRLDCSGVTNEDDLERIFTTVYFSSTNIFLLTIQHNTDLKYLTRNVFGDFTIERINFDTTVLEYIDQSVFVGSYSSLLEIFIGTANLKPEGFPFNTLDQYTSLTSLYLNNAGTFDVLPKLVSNSIRKLRLPKNKISFLQDQVFDGLPKLEWLELTWNILKSLPSGIFKNNPVLKQVGIDSNIISAIETGTFGDLLHLEYVSIEYNKITEIKAGAFYNLPVLSKLVLGTNDLSFLIKDSFAILPSLTHLYLDHNSIQFIDQDLLRSCVSLSFVTVSVNSLSSILPGTFDVMQSGNLYVSNNQLTTLEESWLHPVLLNNNNVYAQANPLDCGCDMAWLYEDDTLMTKLSGVCNNGTDIQDLDSSYITNNC